MTGRHEYYDDEGNETKERCPECGEAFLADHDDRTHCGHCGFTEWK